MQYSNFPHGVLRFVDGKSRVEIGNILEWKQPHHCLQKAIDMWKLDLATLNFQRIWPKTTVNFLKECIEYWSFTVVLWLLVHINMDFSFFFFLFFVRGNGKSKLKVMKTNTSPFVVLLAPFDSSYSLFIYFVDENYFKLFINK